MCWKSTLEALGNRVSLLNRPDLPVLFCTRKGLVQKSGVLLLE
jgi:hypothetical protein